MALHLKLDGVKASPLAVAHVTESLGGGVVTSLARLTMRQAEQGMSVTLYFTRRDDTPPLAELEEIFGPRVALVEAPSGSRSMVAHGLWIMSTVRGVIMRTADVIHFHSSVGGAFGRLALFGRRRGPVSFYSPHGFSFLRTDYSPTVRSAYRIVEQLLGRYGHSQLVLVSRSEAEVATRVLRTSRCFVISNGVALDALPPRECDPEEHLPVVAMVGRIAYQKAPWKFAEVARHFRGRARFVWIGDGDNDGFNDDLAEANIEKTGWLTYPEALRTLATADVLLFLTLWEGMPLAVMEAQSIGIPVIASNIVGNVDIVENGRTGFLVDTVEEAIACLERLIGERGLAEQFYQEALRVRETRWSDIHLGIDSCELYGGRLPAYTASETQARGVIIST
ncbi:hypothetical protein B7R54_03090 [Subtercola boreus]|uniref:D-inositol 3-phosphate glycosyltransferase n=1 Tax=Subtercola boreus TaxID=120213 RepID=A0A3E0VG21_9MICO|nr:glycosyltransferase [Subtercola boreus]RFA08320.1 hypothetical protein B7R54_03090 [Subtercola boreus]TQL54776.1 glycosyltransferase involved in cell wall biosynthesis [Subtercola boreus]